MGDDGFIWIAAALAIAGVAVLRLSWGRPARSNGFNLAGWAALLVACMVADRFAGEWGIAVTILAAISAAFAALALSAREPARKVRAKTFRQARRKSGEPPTLARSGWVTFAVAGPLALAASVLIALSVRTVIIGLGGAEADGNVAVLAAVPVAFPLLTFALLMMPQRGVQCGLLFGLVLALAAAAAPFLLLQGGLA